MAFLISFLASRIYVALRRQGGQAMVEYAIILILVSVVCVVVLITNGAQLQNLFSNVTCGFGHCAPPPDPVSTPTPPCNGVCRNSG
jgi:Flp pilus assembly pilin Flp